MSCGSPSPEGHPAQNFGVSVWVYLFHSIAYYFVEIVSQVTKAGLELCSPASTSQVLGLQEHTH